MPERVVVQREGVDLRVLAAVEVDLDCWCEVSLAG